MKNYWDDWMDIRFEYLEDHKAEVCVLLFKNKESAEQALIELSNPNKTTLKIQEELDDIVLFILERSNEKDVILGRKDAINRDDYKRFTKGSVATTVRATTIHAILQSHLYLTNLHYQDTVALNGCVFYPKGLSEEARQRLYN